MIKIDRFNVLIVDDEHLIRQSVRRKIEGISDSFRITDECSDGEQALKLLKEKDIHIVFTDIRMPVMDGLRLAAEIHARYPDIITVILSGYADFSYAQTAVREGVFDYLLKPVTAENVKDVLERIEVTLQKKYELPGDPSLSKRSAKESVDYAVHYMRERYMDDIDLGALAEKMGFTSAYLTKLFNKFLGEAPLKYLTSIRINEAKKILLATDEPIARVGEMVGYPDQFYFSRTFRKYTGYNPSTYRKIESSGSELKGI